MSCVWQSVPDSRLHLYYLQHYDGFLVLLRSCFRSWKVPKPAQKSFCWLSHRQESGCEPGFWCHSIAPCTSSIQSFRCSSQMQFSFRTESDKRSTQTQSSLLMREPNHYTIILLLSGLRLGINTCMVWKEFSALAEACGLRRSWNCFTAFLN